MDKFTGRSNVQKYCTNAIGFRSHITIVKNHVISQRNLKFPVNYNQANQTIQFVKAKIIVGKGKKCWLPDSILSFSLNVFKSPSSSGVAKTYVCLEICFILENMFYSPSSRQRPGMCQNDLTKCQLQSGAFGIMYDIALNWRQKGGKQNNNDMIFFCLLSDLLVRLSTISYFNSIFNFFFRLYRRGQSICPLFPGGSVTITINNIFPEPELVFCKINIAETMTNLEMEMDPVGHIVYHY